MTKKKKKPFHKRRRKNNQPLWKVIVPLIFMYIAIASCVWMLFIYRFPPKYTIQNEITHAEFECTSHVDGIYCCEIQSQFWYLTDYDGDRVYDFNRTMYPNCRKYVLNELKI